MKWQVWIQRHFDAYRQEAEGILSGQLTLLKRIESEVTRHQDGAGVGF